MEASIRTRRRDADLKGAILDAAWEQLQERGVESFTYDAIAARARTSKPVLYRRWPNRQALLTATVRRRMEARPVAVPDSGTLRGDLVDLLRQGNEKRADMIPLLAALGLYLNDIGMTPAELREGALSGTRPIMDQILDRARARGELRAAVLPQRVRDLPFGLLRSEVLMTLQPLQESAIESIVDDVFLPLLRAYEPEPSRPAKGDPPPRR